MLFYIVVEKIGQKVGISDIYFLRKRANERKLRLRNQGRDASIYERRIRFFRRLS